MIWITVTSVSQIFKRLNIKYDKTMFTHSSKDKWNNKKAANASDEVAKYFPGFLPFINCTELQIPRPAVDNKRKKLYYSGKKKNIL